jgi:hypothetical protein
MKILRDHGLHRRRFIDPNGETNRKPQVIIAKRPGQMVHVDIKKVGKIPGGGGWRAHGYSDKAKRSQRRKTKNKQPRIGYTYLHSAIDGNTRLAYTEARDNETAATAIDFMHNARVLFAAHGITRIERAITDNDRVIGQPISQLHCEKRGTTASIRTPLNTTEKSNATTASSPKNCSTPANTPESSNDVPPSKSGTFTTITTDRIQHVEDDRPPLTAGIA